MADARPTTSERELRDFYPAAYRRLVGALRLMGVPHDEAVEVAQEAFVRLGDGQREAVVLHYLYDLPVDRVAAELGVAEGTVKSRLARARTALAADLGTFEEAHDG